MTTKELVLSGLSEGAQITIAPAFTEARESALTLCRGIDTVSDAEGLQRAATALGGASSLIRSVEKTRKAVKEPVLELGKAIDAKAREAVEELEREQKRVTRAIDEYQAEQHRLRVAAEKLRQEEERKKAEELRRQEAAAEQLRKDAEWAASKGDTAKQEAAEEKALELELAGESAALTTTKAPAVVAPVAVRGLVTKTQWNYEILGDSDDEMRASVRKFYAAFPHLCNVEIKRSAVLADLNGGSRLGAPEDVNPTAPGLKIYKTTSSFTR